MQAVAKGLVWNKPADNELFATRTKNFKKNNRQDSIPVGCVPPACQLRGGSRLLKVWYETDERRDEPLYPRTKSLNISLDSESFTRWLVWGARDRDPH